MLHTNNGSIDKFDRQYFESILPNNKKTGEPLWTRTAIQGEWVYLIEFGFGQDAFILIRSSVDCYTNLSRETGNDSIRIYIVNSDLKPLLGKTQRWFTRKAGWEKKIWENFSVLRQQFTKLFPGLKCPYCGKLLPVLTSKGNKTNFVKCFDCDGKDGWATYKKISLDI